MTQIKVGVDSSKAWLDAWIAPDHNLRCANTPEGIADLARFVRTHAGDDALVVLESSGGCEKLAFVQLWADGISCAIINPRQARAFAEAMGYLEKTDRIDAQMLARFAEAKQLVPTPPPSEGQARLEALAAGSAADTWRSAAGREYHPVSQALCVGTYGVSFLPIMPAHTWRY